MVVSLKRLGIKNLAMGAGREASNFQNPLSRQKLFQILPVDPYES
jgi:hypothetical protein